MNQRRCYISKAYSNTSSGGNKAKTDVERIMENMGFINLGLKQSVHHNPIVRFFLTLTSILKACFLIKKNDILVVQYPLKKYYRFICSIVNLKGAKVITLVHDLGSFRRKKITISEEKKRLSKTNYIIALNDSMKGFFLKSGYTQPVGTLEIWDYLSDSQPKNENKTNQKIEIVYAGSPSKKANSFLYLWDKENASESIIYTIYGNSFDLESLKNKEIYDYKGFVQSDELIRQATGDYGMVWYGHSLSEINGAYGGYIELTSVHKLSLYIRCHMPLIAWSKSAQAKFIKEHNIGICVNSLEQLDAIISNITPEEYLEMKQNTISMSKKLETGYFFKKAYLEAEKILKAQVS